MISLHNVSKSFKNQVIYKNLNIDINKGHHIVLSGENGSGKTTLLMILKGLYDIDSGNISYTDRLQNKKQILYVSKNSNSFFMRLTLEENLIFFYNLCLNKSKLPLSNLYNLVEYFDLNNYLKKEFCVLSSGQAQKASLIRGIIRNPDLMMFDESFHSLDDNSINKFKCCLNQDFLDIKNKTIIWVTHNTNELDFLNPSKLHIKNKNIIKLQ